MEEQLHNYNLISLDIFDTLLLRTVAKPTDVFELLWQAADTVKRNDLSPKEFMKLRAEMERRARNKKASREVCLFEIYAEFPDYIVTDTQALMELEVETEKAVCYRNDYLYDLVLKMKADGKKLVLLSDMYLNREQIIGILQVNGIDVSLFESIILSNEQDCSKQSGELYQVLLKQFPDMPLEDIIHIGDNKNGDYHQARQAGISAIYYSAVPDQLNSIYDYERIRHNIPQKEILSLRKTVVWHGTRQWQTDDEKTAYEIGASVIGPYLTAYVGYVCDRMEQLNIHRIFPLMREGYILGKLLESEAAYRGYELEVHPIYVSRKATYIPSIQKIDREEIENMIGARNLTVGESFRLMGLTAVRDMEEYADCRWKDTHLVDRDGQSLKEYLINKFLEPQNIKSMEQYVSSERKLLIEYLKQEIGDFTDIATIDIGFFGRIQLWLEKALDLENTPHKIKHFLGIGVTGDKIFDGMDFEGYSGSFAENQDLIATIHRTTDVIEKFISVTEGSTVGYCRMEGRIEPVKAKAVANDKITNASFAGILDFQRAFHCLATQKPEIAKKVVASRRESLMVLHRLIDMPRLCEAQLIQSIEADTNFGTEYCKRIITEENLALADEKGVDFIDRCNISYTYQNSNVVWPKGVVTLKSPYYYVRRAMKSNAGNEITKSMQEVVERVKEDGVTEVALYGAGENGRQFYFICQLYEVQVNCFIDRKESLWGTRKEGVEVMGLEEAVRRGYDVYIVTSLFSISEIRETIRERYQSVDRKVEIYSV